jgi:hypothetical protein
MTKNQLKMTNSKWFLANFYFGSESMKNGAELMKNGSNV